MSGLKENPLGTNGMVRGKDEESALMKIVTQVVGLSMGWKLRIFFGRRVHLGLPDRAVNF